MRTIIINATLVDGTGSGIRRDSAVVLQDHLIEEVLDRSTSYYDRADVILDARGGFVLPGLVNHHAHGLTRGPLMISGEPALSDRRVQSNMDRMLRQGVTTAMNVDGFPSVEDCVASSKHHALTVKSATLHTPQHLAWAADGPFPFGGIKEAHRWSLDHMVERGAVAIGEAGPGLDPHWSDYALVPELVRRLDGSLRLDQVRNLRQAVEAGDRETVHDLLVAAGASNSRADDFIESYGLVRHWSELARLSLEEAIGAAHERQLPIVFHHTSSTHELQLESAALNGERHIAAHSNFQCTSAEEALDRAAAVRKAGGLVDIMSGDCFGAREFQDSPDVTYALLANGRVDLLSTDYGGGFWDSMLLLVENAAEAGAITIEEGIRLCTSAPADAVPGLAPDRGRVLDGKVGDLVITAPGELSRVYRVLISGREVPLPANDWS